MSNKRANRDPESGRPLHEHSSLEEKQQKSGLSTPHVPQDDVNDKESVPSTAKKVVEQPQESAEDGSSAKLVNIEHDPVLSELFGLLGDTRRVRVVLLRAEGHSWKRCCAEVGVTDDTVILWRRRYPMDQLIARISLGVAQSGVARIAAKMEQAAEIICDHMDGRLTEDLDAEKLKASAAKTTLGLVVRLLEKSQEQRGNAATRNTATRNTSKYREMPTAELLARAQEIRRRRLGKGEP